jgi:hypothetical protein
MTGATMGNKGNQDKKTCLKLEIALWKMMNEEGHQNMATHSQNEIMDGVTTTQSQCSATCGDDVDICDILPYLIFLYLL